VLNRQRQDKLTILEVFISDEISIAVIIQVHIVE